MVDKKFLNRNLNRLGYGNYSLLIIKSMKYIKKKNNNYNVYLGS